MSECSLTSRVLERANETFRENAPSRLNGPAHPLYPALAEALRVLAADRDVVTSDELRCLAQEVEDAGYDY